MNRYFFYSLLMCMLINIMVYVPNILLAQRFQGGIMGTLCSVPISTILIYAFSTSMMKFPGKGLPEIFDDYFPKWLRNAILLYLAIMWYLAAVIVLVAFSVLTKRFINPDMSLPAILLLFSSVCCFSATRSSTTVLYILEIVIILSVPFILFIITKALISKYLIWDAIWSMKHYVWQYPSLSSIAAATYTFTGYINMSIFNRVFEGKFTTKYFWVIPIFGSLNLFATFAVPIGFLGTMAVGQNPFPWVATSDTLRLELAFIERVLFPFLLLYLNISLLFAIVTWHVSVEMIKSVFPQLKTQVEWKKYVFFMIKFGLFVIPPMVFIHWYDQPAMFSFANFWLNIRLISEVLLVGFIFFLSKRRKKVS